MDVFAGGKEAAAVALFLPAGFLAAFLAATFFAGAFLTADFFTAAFLTAPVLPGAFFIKDAFPAAFFAGTFLVAAFFTGAFFAAAFFTAIFFGADDFFATAFFTEFFFAGVFFAVAISFLLDQSYRSNCQSTDSYRSTAAIHHPKSTRQGRSGAMNRVADRVVRRFGTTRYAKLRIIQPRDVSVP